MKLEKFSYMAQRYWQEQRDKHGINLPPEAQFVTGNYRNDAMLHWMLVDNGVEIVLQDESNGKSTQWRLVNYNVVDEPKFTMFLLRWA